MAIQSLAPVAVVAVASIALPTTTSPTTALPTTRAVIMVFAAVATTEEMVMLEMK